MYNPNDSTGWRRWIPTAAGHFNSPKTPMSTSILIVDDEPNVRLMYRASLSGLGYDLHEAASAEAALEQFRTQKFDAAILDLRMPGMNGLELLEKMHQVGIQTPVAFITAYGDEPNAVRAMGLGAIDFLSKPPTPDQLRDVVKDILLRHSPEFSSKADRDSDYYVRCAKRAINLRDFPAASKNLIKALDLNAGSKQAINLIGVMIEMREEFESAKLR
jgi:DNA-binding NtrC family response regulator